MSNGKLASDGTVLSFGQIRVSKQSFLEHSNYDVQGVFDWQWLKTNQDLFLIYMPEVPSL